ncbi:MAG: LysE family translocator [Pseudomonadota bacterium]
MSVETLLALAAFAFAASWTPGPNNALLAASGANYGFRRTLPHVAGIVVGFSAMMFLAGLGMGAAFERVPWLAEVMRWAGAAVLLWFAWRIAAAGSANGTGRSRPFSFFEAAGFQWINPKAWAICIGVVSQFASARTGFDTALQIASVFALAGASATLGWAGFGAALQRLLSTPLRLRCFNVAMAALIGLFVLMMLTEPL